MLERLDERMRRAHGARVVAFGYRQGPVPTDHPQRAPVIVRTADPSP